MTTCIHRTARGFCYHPSVAGPVAKAKPDWRPSLCMADTGREDACPMKDKQDDEAEHANER